MGVDQSSSRETAGQWLSRAGELGCLEWAPLLVAWCVLALIVFVLVGVAITVGVVLLLLIPALAIVALVGSLTRREP